jgi:hypothetical protein
MPHARCLAVCSLALAGCVSFSDARTRSGGFCTDMPIYPAGQTPDKPFHRLQPVASALKPLTEAERLESLRRVACKLGADAVIEAVNETAQNSDHVTLERSSGYAVVWTAAPTAPTPVRVTRPAPVEKPATELPPESAVLPSAAAEPESEAAAAAAAAVHEEKAEASESPPPPRSTKKKPQPR